MKHDPSTPRRYLAIYLPLLSSERLVRQWHGKAPDAPFVLVEKQRGAFVLAACDKQALSLGLIPGLPLADARARVPGLGVYEHELEADQALLEWLADGCERYTPSCALHGSQTILLDIGGAAHLHGGEQQLLEDLQDRIVGFGLTARFALGTTPDSARARARFDCDDIHALPVTALDVDPAVAIALHRAGLKSIGDLATRPRTPLSNRFGKICVLQLARLLEEEDPHLIPRRSRPAVRVERRFAEPLARSEAVLQVLSALVAKAAIQLSERGQGGRGFKASLFRSDGHVACLSIETGAPTRDPELLVRLFRERIDALADPLDPGFGYDMIALDVLQAETLHTHQQEIDGSLDIRADLQALADRISIRLGKEYVLNFRARESHIPEHAVALEPVLSGHLETKRWSSEAQEPPLRPFTLYEPPQPVEVTAVAIPDGPPARFRWRRRTYRIALAEGPERIEPEWWRYRKGHEFGPSVLTRDYYRVEAVEGHRFWLFRKGLYGEAERPSWYLHGAFA